MRDTIGVVFLVEGDGHLGPLELCRGGEGVNSVHLLLGDAALYLRELGVFLLGASHWVPSLQGRLLGLALLAKGATDVALHASTVLEEVLCLPPMEWAGGLEPLLEVF